MNLRIGRIPFLVCAPFFHRFLKRPAEVSEISFIDGVPSSLNRMLWNGEIHLAPASSIAYARSPGTLVLVSDICTSCNLEVQSVELFSKVPIESLSEHRVHLTAQSGTSVALLQILCSQYVGVKPNFVQDSFGCDAKLLIGDEALKERAQGSWPFCYDLARLWLDWQKVPFVFGAWSVHRSALLEGTRKTLDRFLEQVRESLREFRADPCKAIETWKAQYPVPFDSKALKSYYEALDYNFTDERKKSLEIYFNLCAKENLIKCAPPLRFL